MQHILKHLFKADSLEEVSRERLEELVQEYPSYSVGHFLLSRKLHLDDAVDFAGETLKTNLYFHNPFWLQWQLRNDGKGEIVRNEPVASQVVPPFVLEKGGMESVAAHDGVDGSESGMEPMPRETEPVLQETEPMPQETEPLELEIPAMVTDTAPETEMTGEEEKPRESSADQLLRSILEARNLRMAMRKTIELSTPKEEIPAPQEEAAPDHSEHTDTTLVHAMDTSEHPAEVPVTDDHPEPVTGDHHPEPVTSEHHEEPAAENQILEPVSNETHIGERHEMTDAGIGNGSLNLTANGGSHVGGGGDQIFESFHTIDYFASQGIKLSLDENPDDRLGKQMKSFTDWLKVMKRLPQKNVAVVPDLAAEHQVQTIAAHSIEGKEVLTETMAEVLVKQGMFEKATEVYHKLSLLNPGKSSYFAARIEQLKQH